MRGLLLVAWITQLGACIVLPVPTPEHGLLSGRGEIESAELPQLELGRTNREQVLLILGEPGLSLDDGKILVYEWSVTRAYVLWAVGMYYSGAGDIAAVGKQYAFLVEFDSAGVVRRMDRQSVGMFESFAEAVDAWTPADSTRLASLSLTSDEIAITPDAERWVLDVPTDSLLDQSRLQVDEKVAVRLPRLTEARGPHLAGFKTPGNSYAVATVSTTESPDHLLRDSFVNGWRQTSLEVVEESGIELTWEVRNFSVSSPVSLTSWKAQATIELDLTVKTKVGLSYSRTYRSTKAVRTLLGPGPEHFSEVLAKCLVDLAEQVGVDLLEKR